MRKSSILVAAAVLAMGSAMKAGPVTVDFSSSQSVRGLDSFGGSAVYDTSTDQLTLTITNTSTARLTAFAFDTEAGDVAKYDRAAKSPWKNEPNKKDVVNAKPFGKYDGGAAINGKWGSLSKRGIAAGASETFVFDITGANASSLTAADFFTDSTKPQIVATFAGYRHHKPDRAGGFGHVVVTNSESPGGSTPAPTNNDAPILSVVPPVVNPPPQFTRVPPPSDGRNGPSAVPLPPAAPAGGAMLGIIALAGLVRRIRGRIG